jgi:predicted TIM-barrel fold metal-dependent hydrolase
VTPQVDPADGGMWFGGPNQALIGHPDKIRESNDAHFALAKKHPEMLPIATVHPYDGEAAIEEVSRVAALGFKVLKLHPHTQKFDPSDPRVLAVVTRAGDLGMIVLMDNFNIIPGDSEKLFNLALAAPGTKFIFAHLGGMNFRFWNVIRAAARIGQSIVGGGRSVMSQKLGFKSVRSEPLVNFISGDSDSPRKSYIRIKCCQRFVLQWLG